MALHVGPFRTRDQTRVSRTGRQILYHWATRETPEHFLKCDPEENNGALLTLYGHLDCSLRHPNPSDLEKEMATYSSILAWRSSGTEEPGGLLSMGSHRVRHDQSDSRSSNPSDHTLSPDHR